MKTGGRPTAEAAEPRLTLAAFGKHPGWDDHIPGIGVETDTLAHVKQAFYVSGIGGQIDSGVWEKLEVDKRLEDFDHIFLWLRAGHVLLGQLWSSTDGKGRLKYPMVLCVDGEDVSPSFMIRNLRPGLDRLRDACKAATSADKVIQDCRMAQEQVRALLSDPAVRSAEAAPPLEARRQFLGRRELGPDRLGLLRILHELGSAPGASVNGRSLEAGVAGNTRSRHLRLPLASDSRSQSLLLWAAFLRCAVPEPVPLLLIVRRGAAWLDVIIGEPASDDLFCLQAATVALPLATEIPYDIAPELKPALERLEEKFLGLESAPVTDERPFVKPASTRPMPSTPSESNLQNRPCKPSGSRKPWFFLGLGVALLFAIIGIWFSSGRHHTAKSPPAVSKADADYRTAMAEAQRAWRATNLDETIKQARLALKSKPGDAEASKLVNQAEEEIKYQSTLAAAQAAFDRKEYAEAVSKAEAVQGIRANDPAAAKLKTDAQTQLDIVNKLNAQEQQYQAAMKEGRAALERNEYSSAITQAGLALAIKVNDSAAMKLKSDSQAQLQIANTRKAQQDAEAAKAAQQAQQQKPNAAAPAPSKATASGTDKKNRTNELGMEFVWITGVSGGGGFMGKCEVTQKQFHTVTGTLPADQAAEGDDLPVANATIAQAKDFCERLSKNGKHYTLPSKADWLAAAGLSPEQENDAWKLLSDKGMLDHEVTSFNLKPALKQPARVGSRGTQTNGLSDLFGNVREWVTTPDGSAGFSFDTEGIGQRKALFVTGEALKSITGFRCVLRDGD